MRALRTTAILCTLLAGLAHADTFGGRVIAVADGDTVTVRTDAGEDIKVRLGGIDAPEWDQPWGAQAKARLAGLVDQQKVRVEGSKRDPNGRLVAKLWVRPSDCRGCGFTLDANLAQITAGAAWWYRHYARDQSAEDRERYEFAETEARAKRAGLWAADRPPVPPWEWRHAAKPRYGAPSAGRAAETPECRIKGNINDRGDRIYHVPGQQHYAATRISTARGERWFCSAEEAQAAGWRPARQ